MTNKIIKTYIVQVCDLLIRENIEMKQSQADITWGIIACEKQIIIMSVNKYLYASSVRAQ